MWGVCCIILKFTANNKYMHYYNVYNCTFVQIRVIHKRIKTKANLWHVIAL